MVWTTQKPGRIIKKAKQNEKLAPVSRRLKSRDAEDAPFHRPPRAPYLLPGPKKRRATFPEYTRPGFGEVFAGARAYAAVRGAPVRRLGSLVFEVHRRRPGVGGGLGGSGGGVGPGGAAHAPGRHLDGGTKPCPAPGGG